MAFDYSQLSNWNDVDGTITVKALVNNHLAGIPGIHQINIPSGALSIEAPYLYSTPLFRSSTCGWATSGTTYLGNRTVTTYGVELMENLCGKQLKSKVAAYFMTGNGIEGFSSELMQEKTKQIAKTSQNIAINGSTATGVGELSLGNGLLYKLDNTYSASSINVTKTAYTNSNAISVMDAVLSNIPDEIRDMDKLVALVAPASFASLQIALRQANYFNYNTTGADSFSFDMPGYNNVTVYSVPTLATNRTIVTYPQNIIHALGVETPLEMWFSKDNQQYFIHADWFEAYDLHFEGLVVRM